MDGSVRGGRRSLLFTAIAVFSAILGAMGVALLPQASFPVAVAWGLAAGVVAILLLRMGALRRDAAVAARAHEDARMRALLHSTLESTTDGILTVDLQGRIVSHNQRTLEMWRVDVADLSSGDRHALACVLDQLVHPERFIRRLEEIYAAPASSSSDLIEFRDGRIYHRTSLPHRLGDQIVGRVWSFRDITEQRRTETALADSERRFRRMVTNVPGVIFQFYVRRDDTLWFTYLSEGCQALLGVSPEVFPWRADSLVARVDPQDMRALVSTVTRATATMESWIWDGRITLHSGVTRWFRAASRPTRHADGKVTWDGLLMDITGQKEAAAALEKRVHVEQVLTRVSRMLAAPAADISEVLRLLAEVVEADRAYLFRSRSEDASTMMDVTHEWCRDGVSPAAPQLQGIDIERAPWWVRALRTGPSLVIQRVEEMPAEAAFERSLLEQHGVHAAAAVPVTDARNGLLGFIGFDYMSPGRSWSEEDVRVLQTAGEMLVSHFARALAEREILQRDAILEAANFMAERFLKASDWEGGIDPALAIVGAAAGVSRAYLFQTYPGEDGEILVGQRAEWVAEGIEPMMPMREFSRASLTSLGLARWDELFRRNQPVQGVISTLPEYEAMCLGAQGIRSILQIPIFVGDRWWGTLGFDDCVAERKWSIAEWEVLATTGRMIAAAVQRTQAEEALRESEERFRQMAESMSEVFFMVSVDSREVIYLSPAYETVWGRPRYDTAGFLESILPEDRHILFADMALSEAGTGDALRHIEYRIARPDGTIRWIHHRTFQVRDAEGRPYRVTGVCSDVTEQKQMEEELRRANRIEAIGHLAAGIAHEINTPIQYIGDNVRFLDVSYQDLRTAIDACRALLRDADAGPVTPERVAQVAEVIVRTDVDYVLEEAPRATAQALDGVQRVAEIVRAMKEFSHPGSGQKVPTDLNQAIRSTTTVARSEWKYVAELVTDLEEELPPVPCLPGELNQAVLNLVVNAAHAVADRQQAEGTDHPGLIVVSTRTSGDFVEIRVTDTGTGIPSRIRGRIFDPFFTTKEVGRGTGQGLTFVHSIVVEKHDGTVTFETEEGVGTTFVLRIPHRDPRGLSEAA